MSKLDDILRQQQEKQARYESVVGELLGGVRIFNCGKVVPPWETPIPNVTVPACLEIVGLNSEITDRLRSNGLEVYFPEFDFYFIEDQFPEYSPGQRIEVLEGASPHLLGWVNRALDNYHRARSCVNGRRVYISPNTTSFYGRKDHPLIAALFSDEFIQKVISAGDNWRYKNDENGPAMMEIEGTVVRAFAQAVKKGYQL